MFYFPSDHSAKGRKGDVFWDAGQEFVSTITTWSYAHLMWQKEKKRKKNIYRGIRLGMDDKDECDHGVCFEDPNIIDYWERKKIW